MKGVPQGAPFMFSVFVVWPRCNRGGRVCLRVISEVFLAPEFGGRIGGGARRGVFRGRLRLRLARLLDPLNLKRIIPAKETSKVTPFVSPVFSTGRFVEGRAFLPCNSRTESWPALSLPGLSLFHSSWVRPPACAPKRAKPSSSIATW